MVPGSGMPPGAAWAAARRWLDCSNLMFLQGWNRGWGSDYWYKLRRTKIWCMILNNFGRF